VRGYGEEHMRPMYEQGEQIPYVVDMRRNAEVEKDLLSNKGNVTQGDTHCKQTNEQESLGIFAYRIKCKWEDQMKKEFLKLREEHEGDCA